MDRVQSYLVTNYHFKTDFYYGYSVKSSYNILPIWKTPLKLRKKTKYENLDNSEALFLLYLLTIGWFLLSRNSDSNVMFWAI